MKRTSNLPVWTRYGLILLVGLLCSMFSGCVSCTQVDPGTEAVLVHQPWIFGHGGVEEKTVKPGLQWHWVTTDLYHYNVTPVKFSESFNDIMTSDNFPIDMDFEWEFQVLPDQAWKITAHHKNWYKNQIQEPGKAYVRDFIARNKMQDVTVDRAKLNVLELEALSWMEQKLKANGLPIKVNRATAGKAAPPEEVMEERAQTAANTQRKSTEDARKIAEDARKAAEVSKALADKAYMREMNFNAAQYLELRRLELLEKKAGNITWIIGGGEVQNMRTF